LVIGCFTLAAIGLTSFVWIELFVTKPLIDVGHILAKGSCGGARQYGSGTIGKQRLWH
jgi:hypothetical protein